MPRQKYLNPELEAAYLAADTACRYAARVNWPHYTRILEHLDPKTGSFGELFIRMADDLLVESDIPALQRLAKEMNAARKCKAASTPKGLLRWRRSICLF